MTDDSGLREQAIEAARTAAFRTDDGSLILHSFRGFLGADWDLDGVIDTIRSARQVTFGPDLLGHHLKVVEADGRLIRFDVPMPAAAERSTAGGA